MRPAAVVLAGAVALALAVPAAGGLRHSTVAQDVRVPSALLPRGAHLLLRRADVQRFAAALGERDATRVAAVDFRRHVVVAAFAWVPDPCHAFRIAALERRASTLVVRAVRSAVRGEHEACIQVVAGGYHVVKVPRRAFRGRVPAGVVLRVRAG